jgi:uncharacterized protein YydD (DUF2326 family)
MLKENQIRRTESMNSRTSLPNTKKKILIFVWTPTKLKNRVKSQTSHLVIHNGDVFESIKNRDWSDLS